MPHIEEKFDFGDSSEVEPKSVGSKYYAADNSMKDKILDIYGDLLGTEKDWLSRTLDYAQQSLGDEEYDNSQQQRMDLLTKAIKDSPNPKRKTIIRKIREQTAQLNVNEDTEVTKELLPSTYVNEFLGCIRNLNKKLK